MSCTGNPRWTATDMALLAEHYTAGGLPAALLALPARSHMAITAQASKHGIRSPIVGDAPKAKLQGDNLTEAVRLRENLGWGFARIGAHFGISESAASNAVTIALCPIRGFRPAARDKNGRLMPAELERLRLMLRKGMKGIDIQLQMGVSAGVVAEQRRRYERDLKERGKASLPAPGNGMAYSGAKVPKAKKQEIEALYLQGYGVKKIVERVGVSNTHVLRTRSALIRRLRKKGQALPGCDINGVRFRQTEHARHIDDATIANFRNEVISGVPVARAALSVGIGTCTAYRFRDQIAAELAERGQVLPKPVRNRRGETQTATEAAALLPPGSINQFRKLCLTMPAAEAKALIITEKNAEQLAEEKRRRIEASRPLTFEQQLARVRAGAGLVAAFVPRKADHDFTLGGVGSGML
jgi:predicted DNA-binding protein (UPF0251 family)